MKENKKTSKTTKKKRIKKVFSSSGDVLHRWANQSQTEARCGNVFFKGLSCFSYGHHYELGRIIEYKGVKMAVINNEGYSNTTSKHIRQAQSAVEGLIPYVSSPDGFDKQAVFNALLKEQQTVINHLMGFLNRQVRSYDKYDIERLGKKHTWGFYSSLREFNKLVIALKEPQLVIKENEVEPLIEVIKDHVRDMIKVKAARDAYSLTPEAIEKKAKEVAQRQAALLKKNENTILKWRNNEIHSLPWDLRLDGVLLRVVNNEVQTSKGARVELQHALRLLKRVKNNTAQSGEHIGPYTFNQCSNGVVKIGCHSIQLSEAENVLGNIKIQPSLELVK